MAHVVIIGGGFAGVWSAAGAALARKDADLRVTLIAPNEGLVLRPRLYEPELDLAKVALSRILEPIGVEHIRAAVSTIDTDRHVVVADGVEVGYDRLVLAAGSQLVAPEGLPGAERLFDIDTLDGARRLDKHLRGRKDFSALVVGAGFVGLEVATALADRGRVVLVDRAQVVGEQLGPGPRNEIESALDVLGIACRLGTTVTEIGEGYAALSDGTVVEADAVVWSVGMKASALTQQVSSQLDHLGRVLVDQQLRALPEVFVAGDTAAAAVDAEHMAMQACQHATPLGKVAGFNAAADLLGVPLRDFVPGPYVTCLDLGSAGAVFTRGWDRRVMATGAVAAEIKKQINDAIHPPVDDRVAILAAADLVSFDPPFFSAPERDAQPVALHVPSLDFAAPAPARTPIVMDATRGGTLDGLSTDRGHSETVSGWPRSVRRCRRRWRTWLRCVVRSR